MTLRNLTDEEAKEFKAKFGKRTVTYGALLDYGDLVVAAIAKQIKPALARIEALEKGSQPTLSDVYRGGWGAGFYKRGSLVTFSGSLFLAMADTRARPETDSAWVMVTKRGRNAKG